MSAKSFFGDAIAARLREVLADLDSASALRLADRLDRLDAATNLKLSTLPIVLTMEQSIDYRARLALVDLIAELSE